MHCQSKSQIEVECDSFVKTWMFGNRKKNGERSKRRRYCGVLGVFAALRGVVGGNEDEHGFGGGYG
jgi:hypothetical protein